MLIEEHVSFFLSFGDAQSSIEPRACSSLTSQLLFLQEPFMTLQKKMHLNSLVFLHQVHGAQGLVILDEKQIKDQPLFSQDGDYLITNQPGIGLGILTADCLPLVFADTKNKVIAIAHAGWKGSFEHIALVVLSRLQNDFGCKKENLQVFFGPAAKPCCYEVDTPFLNKILVDSFAHRAIIKKDKRYFFDLTEYTRGQLAFGGLSDEQLVLNHNACTICHDIFCSYRRQSGTMARQFTVVSLK